MRNENALLRRDLYEAKVKLSRANRLVEDILAHTRWSMSKAARRDHPPERIPKVLSRRFKQCLRRFGKSTKVDHDYHQDAMRVILEVGGLEYGVPASLISGGIDYWLDSAVKLDLQVNVSLDLTTQSAKDAGTVEKAFLALLDEGIASRQEEWED